MAKQIMFAAITDERGEDYGYGLYYVPGDAEGRWILTDNAGVAATNFNIPEELAEVAEQAEALIAKDSGEPARGLGDGALSEAERLMAEWGWMSDLLLSTAQAAKALGIKERRVRKLCEEGRMGRQVGDTWVITPQEIEANRVRVPGRPHDGPMDINRVRVTAKGAEALRERILARDLADEIRAGQTISYNTFTYEGGQAGHILVIHSGPEGDISRAGICFGGNSEWGDWDDKTQTVTLDHDPGCGRIVYDTNGKRVE